VVPAICTSLLKRAESLAPAVEQGVDPDPISYDPRICGSCGFRRVCYPPRDYGEGATVITDELMIEDIRRRHELEPAADEFDELDASIKDRLKLLGVGELTVAASSSSRAGRTRPTSSRTSSGRLGSEPP